MLMLQVSEYDNPPVTTWRWDPPRVKRLTRPEVLASNPKEVVMAIGGLLIRDRAHWRAEGWTHVQLIDTLRHRIIWRTAIDDLPTEDMALLTWSIGKVKLYAHQYQ